MPLLPPAAADGHRAHNQRQWTELVPFLRLTFLFHPQVGAPQFGSGPNHPELAQTPCISGCGPLVPRPPALDINSGVPPIPPHFSHSLEQLRRLGKTLYEYSFIIRRQITASQMKITWQGLGCDIFCVLSSGTAGTSCPLFISVLTSQEVPPSPCVQSFRLSLLMSDWIMGYMIELNLQPPSSPGKLGWFKVSKFLSHVCGLSVSIPHPETIQSSH